MCYLYLLLQCKSLPVLPHLDCGSDLSAFILTRMIWIIFEFYRKTPLGLSSLSTDYVSVSLISTPEHFCVYIIRWALCGWEGRQDRMSRDQASDSNMKIVDRLLTTFLVEWHYMSQSWKPYLICNTFTSTVITKTTILGLSAPGRWCISGRNAYILNPISTGKKMVICNIELSIMKDNSTTCFIRFKKIIALHKRKFMEREKSPSQISLWYDLEPR